MHWLFMFFCDFAAERIELQIGDAPPGQDVTLTTAQFSQLGYINLSTNQHTQHKARELKSVNVKCTGSFLKLIVHKNHDNRLNKYNQVRWQQIMLTLTINLINITR